MNKVKTFFSGLLLLLVVFQFSNVQAEQAVQHSTLPLYQNTIADISLGYKEAMLEGTVKLNSGLVLRIVDYKTRDDNVMKTWNTGDALNFKAQVEDDSLFLTATRLNHKYDEVEALMIFDVTKEPTQSKFGLYIEQIPEGGKFVKLNNGSVWEFSWLNQFTTKKWQVGQRVIVQGEGNINCYEFINLDAPVQLNAHSAKASFVLN